MMKFYKGFINNSEGKTRTYDLRVMSPTSTPNCSTSLYCGTKVIMEVSLQSILLLRFCSYLITLCNKNKMRLMWRDIFSNAIVLLVMLIASSYIFSCLTFEFYSQSNILVNTQILSNRYLLHYLCVLL